jgi:hypothetical protein
VEFLVQLTVFNALDEQSLQKQIIRVENHTPVDNPSLPVWAIVLIVIALCFVCLIVIASSSSGGLSALFTLDFVGDVIGGLITGIFSFH